MVFPKSVPTDKNLTVPARRPVFPIAWTTIAPCDRQLTKWKLPNE